MTRVKHSPGKSREAANQADLLSLIARESAVFAREQAADQREEMLTATARNRALSDAQMREANEHLVIASVRALQMSDAAEQSAKLMSYKAQRDPLTGLPNRALLTDRLAQSIELAQRHSKRVAVMFLDLDHFKGINDTLGHSVGDRLLQSVAGRLQGCLRHSDTVSRQGGDEFVVLLTEVEAIEDATLVAEKLTHVMSEPHCIGEHRLLITVSVGISLYPDEAQNAEALLQNADAAMYEAKRSGRNNFRRFGTKMNGADTAANRDWREASRFT